MSKQNLLNVLKETAQALRGLKFNPYHDPGSGRFSTGGGPKLAPDTGGGTGGGSAGTKPKKPESSSGSLSSLAKPQKHNVDLPKDKRKMNIGPAEKALQQMGYKLNMGGMKPVNGKLTTFYNITDKNGKKVSVDATTLRDFIYSNHSKE